MTAAVLDTIERLLNAAQHPDVTRIYRYAYQGEPALALVYSSGVKAYIRPLVEKPRPKVTAVDLDDVGEWRHRVGYVIQLLTDVLEIARPDGWQWRTVAIEGTDRAPSGVEIRAGQTDVVLKVTCGSASPDSDPASWAGWAIPAERVRAALA